MECCGLLADSDAVDRADLGADPGTGAVPVADSRRKAARITSQMVLRCR